MQAQKEVKKLAQDPCSHQPQSVLVASSYCLNSLSLFRLFALINLEEDARRVLTFMISASRWSFAALRSGCMVRNSQDATNDDEDQMADYILEATSNGPLRRSARVCSPLITETGAGTCSRLGILWRSWRCLGQLNLQSRKLKIVR